MENKSNVIIILLVVLIGVVSGVGLLTGVNNAVVASLSPLNTKLAVINSTEKNIENELIQIQNKINTIGVNGSNCPNNFYATCGIGNASTSFRMTCLNTEI